MTPKIVMDVSSIQYGRGVSRYTKNLFSALSKRKTIEMYALGASLRKYQILRAELQGTPAKNNHLFPIPDRVLKSMWKYGVMTPDRIIRDPSLFHAWEYLPHTLRIPYVVTIHDLAMLRFPKSAHPVLLKTHQIIWDRIKKDHAHVIAVSQATKNDCVELLQLDDSKIHVVYEALPKEQRIVPTKDDILKTKKKFQIEKPFIFFLGTQEPRKNVLQLIEAWKDMKKEFDLVIGGAKGWEKMPVEKGIHYVGYLDPKDSASLYRSASVFAYPSLYEGFGLPMLEAWFHNVPVVSSKTPALVEVGGNAVVQVDQDDPHSISAGILQAVEQRATLVKKGTARLTQFSWDRAAEETELVYRAILQGKNST
ncbi:MAG: Mannosyltransferase B [Microgenomates group bacterium GW2011_GWF2_45_18]|nr:MAG: Mannosyltransferase B [Microgenomates group bacterium GW2011_GWF1_44_10]KKU02330.1 MAG: Mannosyltransferase B [Microgenomates group bacterium GW2011_GWF2_45_18]OGJ41664.1 MAG: hypothetical protein A2378_02155 [Candidatus Pacebacteria bacterium RIFOXYB1_FULL_44_10]HAU99204.1 hypothetical protein [Candidatus Paceibacterota bacterium]